MKGKIIQTLKGYATDSSDKPNTSIDYDRIDDLATDLEKLFSMHFVSNNEVAVCPHCNGRGYITPDRIHSVNCSVCNGTGQTDC